MWVVKLGGSLARNGQLRPWIRAIAGQGEGDGPALAVVPGGGPFADRVREMQASLGFDDSTAHKMAVLGMEQYGLILAELCPKLVPVSSKAALLRACRSGKIPVWMPSRMIFGRDDIPGKWEVTSDSLAAWLARHLKATCLILIKSVDPVSGDSQYGDSQYNKQPEVPLFALQERGIIDRAFKTFADGGEYDVRCVGPSVQAGFPEALRKGLAPGVRVLLSG